MKETLEYANEDDTQSELGLTTVVDYELFSNETKKLRKKDRVRCEKIEGSMPTLDKDYVQ
ncbi:hypothetical protein NECAME_14693 [Necator americanus]|uniref:Uncharacterized protein n=1 Tax=Necator americanus TaxID=51031 RepID=W2SNU6_NECAM|nr:hypothetical protein NECAME_14693 [Necator americanus]ETN70546.1 hypothetical protein NECAME_14693 [Necator americanus]